MENLVVPGSLDQLSTIRSFVDRAAAAAKLERRAAYRLRLAVDEIATNIITYGYEREGLSGDIRLTAHLDAEWLRVSLADDGIAYDPTTAEAPKDLDQPLEHRGIGGLGIFLTLRGVDEFRYQRIEGHNVSTFGMRRTAGPEAAEP